MEESYYFFTDGTISRKDNTLRFTSAEGNKRDLPIENINDLYVMSEMSFNTSLLNLCSQSGIAIHFFNYYQSIQAASIRKSNIWQESCWYSR